MYRLRDECPLTATDFVERGDFDATVMLAYSIAGYASVASCDSFMHSFSTVCSRLSPAREALRILNEPLPAFATAPLIHRQVDNISRGTPTFSPRVNAADSHMATLHGTLAGNSGPPEIKCRREVIISQSSVFRTDGNIMSMFLGVLCASTNTRQLAACEYDAHLLF